MKRIISLVGILSIMAVSCVKEQQEVIPAFADDQVFYATIDGEGEPDTKAYANEQLLGRWDAGDHISIFNKNTINRQYAFQGQTGDNSGEFKKVTGESFYAGNQLDYVYAVYPYSESTSISDEGVITLNLPVVQSYRENTYGLGANTMIAVTEDDELTFKNLCGYFAVKLYGDNVSVKSITLKGNDNELLAGKATVSASKDAAPTLTLDAETPTQMLTLTCPTPVTLGTTEETATTFWFVVPPTTFTGGITIRVYLNTGQVFKKTTTGTLQIKRNTLKRSATLQVIPPIPEAVDLGLSVKWASFNLGATSPEEGGNYYAWGETEPQEEYYDWSTYKWCNGNSQTLTKYNNNSSYGIVDNKTTLDLEDDAAHVNWGGYWRLPTSAMVQELIDNCTFEWTTENNVYGFRFTSKKEGYTDKSIFLPAAGYYSYGIYDSDHRGSYLSSTLNNDEPYYAFSLYFYSSSIRRVFCYQRGFRCLGQSVRPVYYDRIHPTSIVLDKSSLSLYAGRTEQLTATISPADATDKAITWSSDNTAVATVSADGVVTAIVAGSATITATTKDGNLTATCAVTVKPFPEAVDLGLSVKWASFNLGASSPEEYGDYYAWGELACKDDIATYTQSNYKFYENGEYTKYTVNGKMALDSEDDAATVCLGDHWRMPSREEYVELFNTSKTSSKWTTMNGVVGWEITSKANGNSIFIPAGGQIHDGRLDAQGQLAFAWTRDLYLYNNTYAYAICIYDTSGGTYIAPKTYINETGNLWREMGLPIRPIYVETSNN